ncbi:amidohydrolase/deacetylase family metallohydrolase [Acerihabitans arboris]|uniref:Amidohydrolase/deacetylase family metallohydrolase n=1 Tax=Acerihabitans arboris TaxID=2691583 RepID=A0A845SKK2_9GAMM|nr:amidohydrolase/deacetylase family metallohydrolase [Acerihabitans arboris]NDL63526.1 amidohydrolase/deacetylase family metallohydrolase [Acerihabitans arboris]
MYDLIIRQARQPDGSLIDIAVLNGRIAATGGLSIGARREIDLAGRYYASAGWIDSHVHCYPASPIYHDEPDKVGVAGGVTTVVDAGSTGADAVDDFYQLALAAKTRVYALLNIARTGIVTQDELADMARVDKRLAGAAIARHRGFIVGIKARISSSVVGDNGVKPLLCAKEIQRENGNLPLMVHIGNNPPDLGRIADLLDAGDIITHCYNGKPNRILTPAGELRASVRRALKRGVHLDVGHGTASFSFEVARLAIAQGIYPYTISSDIYCRNRIDGPVHGLAAVMAKFFTLGMTLGQVIDCVTLHAADALRLAQKGRLMPGCDADLTLFEVRAAPCVFTDAHGQSVAGEQQLIPLAAVVAGVCWLTDEGKKSHVFDL